MINDQWKNSNKSEVRARFLMEKCNVVCHCLSFSSSCSLGNTSPRRNVFFRELPKLTNFFGRCAFILLLLLLIIIIIIIKFKTQVSSQSFDVSTLTEGVSLNKKILLVIIIYFIFNYFLNQP